MIMVKLYGITHFWADGLRMDEWPVTVSSGTAGSMLLTLRLRKLSILDLPHD